MRKKKFLLSTAILAMALFAASCGKKTADSTEKNKASASEASSSNASPSTLTEDSPEIKELENMKVPEEPKVSEMGKITLPDIKKISVTVAPMKEVTDADVTAAINQALQQDLKTVEEPAKEGDTVNIDYSGTIDGKKFDGGTAEKQDLQLGSGQFIPGFEEQLIGKKAGEKVTVKVTFPKEYSQAPDLAGKEAEFAVTVNAVKRAPELTDQWVKDNKDTTAETVESYKDQIREQLKAKTEFRYHSTIQNDAMQQIFDEAKVEPSEKLMEYAKAYVLNAQLTQYKQYGMGAADVINMSGKSVEEFKKDAYANADSYAKQIFVMRKIADDQKIRPTDALLDSLAEAESSLTGQETNRIKLIEQYGKQVVEEAAVRNAVMEYIESQITVKEEEPSISTEIDTQNKTDKSKGTEKQSEENKETETKETKSQANEKK